MASIRLLHVLEATVGGTRRHLLDLCLGLPHDRFTQHVVCSTLRDGRFLQDIEVLRGAGIEVTVLPMRREISLRSDWQCLRELQQIMAQWQPQIVHGHSSKGGFLARMAVRDLQPRPKVVYNPHGFAFQMRTSPLKRWLYVQLEQHAARWTDVLVAACESQKQLALQYHLLPEDRIAVIPNGIRAQDYEVEIDRAAYRRELGLPEGVKVVGTVAALVPQKGVERLVGAIENTKYNQSAHPPPLWPQENRVPVHAVIAGEGPLRAELEQLAAHLKVSNLVHFLGQRSDIPQFLQALDAFVFTSLWEGFPYALLEAGAAGLPVAATDIPGNRDLIHDRVNGYLGDPNVGIVIALFNRPVAAEWAHALQDLVRREYTLERMVEGHVRLYEGLVRA